MKITYIAMSVCVTICALASSANAAESNAPEISLLNFVSLQYERKGGYAGISSGISVYSGVLWVKSDTRPNQTSETQSFPLSFNQQVALFDNINAAGITNLVGDYRQRNLSDGFNETLTLTISDAQNRDQRYIINNYGDTAPRNFYRFIDYLNELRDAKTGQPRNTAQIVNKDNFQSLTLNILGGIAGIQTQTEIHAPAESGYRQWMISSNERSRGRIIRHQTNINVSELNALFHSLSNANLAKMNGEKYHQQGLYDGFNNILTVTLQDGKKYTVESYGNTAPAGFYQILAEVNQLRQRHFNDN